MHHETSTLAPMRPEPIGDDLRRFILTAVPSVPYLEALLILRSEPRVAWDDAGLAQRLYIGAPAAHVLLQQLLEAGVAVQETPGRFRYAPVGELANILERVANLYAARLVEMTVLIHSRLDRRAAQFAEAFRIRKESR
jgi:hypothetical protein